MKKGEAKVGEQQQAAVRRIAEKIRQTRELNDWNQDGVAAEAKMHLSKYAAIEQASRDCRVSALIQALSGFGIDLVQVIHDALSASVEPGLRQRIELAQTQDHVFALAVDRLRALHRAGQSKSVLDTIDAFHERLPKSRVKKRRDKPKRPIVGTVGGQPHEAVQDKKQKTGTGRR